MPLAGQHQQRSILVVFGIVILKPFPYLRRKFLERPGGRLIRVDLLAEFLYPVYDNDLTIMYYVEKIQKRVGMK